MDDLDGPHASEPFMQMRINTRIYASLVYRKMLPPSRRDNNNIILQYLFRANNLICVVLYLFLVFSPTV